MNSFLKNVLKTIKKYNLITPGDTVLVGVSGGADSVALLKSLISLKETLKIKKIAVCHINHNLRETAKRDEDFVRDLCKKENLDFFIKNADIKEEKERLKVSEEEAGRIVRYDFFHKIKEETGATKIATAHNLNDQVETFFIRLLRGASSDGLISVKPVREDNVIRPLIETKREDIENYLNSINQDFVTDETNFKTDYLRNKIRLMLIPYLKENFSFSEQVILNTIDIFKKDSEYISFDVENILNTGIIKNKGVQFPVDMLSKTHDAVLSRVLKNVLKNLFNVTVSKTKLDSLIKLIKDAKTGKEIKLSSKVYGYIQYDKFIIKEKETKEEYCLDLILGDNIIKEADFLINISEEAKKGEEYILLSDISSLKVRCRKEGDKVYIKNVGHKKVKDLFIDKKVPREERKTYPIILKDDEIIWIPGLYKKEGKDGRYCLTIRGMKK